MTPRIYGTPRGPAASAPPGGLAQPAQTRAVQAHISRVPLSWVTSSPHSWSHRPGSPYCLAPGCAHHWQSCPRLRVAWPGKGPAAQPLREPQASLGPKGCQPVNGQEAWCPHGGAGVSPTPSSTFLFRSRPTLKGVPRSIPGPGCAWAAQGQCRVLGSAPPTPACSAGLSPHGPGRGSHLRSRGCQEARVEGWESRACLCPLPCTTTPLPPPHHHPLPCTTTFPYSHLFLRCLLSLSTPPHWLLPRKPTAPCPPSTMKKQETLHGGGGMAPC